MLIVTGAAGFIGSCLVNELNQLGHEDLLLSDDFSQDKKTKNLTGKKYAQKIHRDELILFVHR